MSRENFISFTINNLNTDGIYKSELITYALTILFFSCSYNTFFSPLLIYVDLQWIVEACVLFCRPAGDADRRYGTTRTSRESNLGLRAEQSGALTLWAISPAGRSYNTLNPLLRVRKKNGFENIPKIVMLKQNLRQGAIRCGEGDQGGSPIQVIGKKGLGM